MCVCCEGILAADLRAVPDVVEDLLITRSKQDNMGEQARVSGSRERPLGFRPGAMSAEDVLRETLRAWAVTIALELGGADDIELPDESVGLAEWLLRHPFAIRRCDQVGEMLNELAYALSNARKAVDRPAEKRFAGRCVCAELLYAYESARFVTCPACGERFEVTVLQAGALTAIRRYVGTAADIAAGVGSTFTDGKITRKLINKWHSRGRIAPRDFAPNGDPMFLVGDVLDLARREI